MEHLHAQMFPGDRKALEEAQRVEGGIAAFRSEAKRMYVAQLDNFVKSLDKENIEVHFYAGNTGIHDSDNQEFVLLNSLIAPNKIHIFNIIMLPSFCTFSLVLASKIKERVMEIANLSEPRITILDFSKKIELKTNGQVNVGGADNQD